ncbi:MAG: FAD:protein FMN transferase [Spirochaetaceae bacterium]|nr:FAD:protein FMN transferase [Spirochaetaceae bacterium]
MKAALPLACFLVLFSGAPREAFCAPQREAPWTREEFLLGTVCSLSLFDEAPPEIFLRVSGRIREIEQRMSVTIPESDIARLNAAAGKEAVVVARETLEVVEAGLAFSRASGGAFNIAVGPLVNLWGIGTERAAVPPREAIDEALSHIDFTKVQTDARAGTVFLRDQGMALDLGAIAKGYAADQAAEVLREAGAGPAIIDLGGNILVLGTRPGGAPWRIGVQNPAKERGQILGVIAARGGTSVVSSGAYERFFTAGDGQRYHHILDTRTGRPVRNGLSQVTVTALSSREADALSTTLFALGLRAGLEFMEKTPGAEALFVTEDKLLYATPGMREAFRLTDTSFRFP